MTYYGTGPMRTGSDDQVRQWQKEQMTIDGMVEVDGCWMTEEEAIKLRKYLEKRKDE